MITRADRGTGGVKVDNGGSEMQQAESSADSVVGGSLETFAIVVKWVWKLAYGRDGVDPTA